MKKLSSFLLLFGLFIQFSCVNQENSKDVRSGVIGGIKHVYNSSEPLKGRISLEVARIFEIDSLSADPSKPIFFHQVAQESAGYSYFADNHTPHIHIFNEKGVWIQSFSVKGDGPGEFSRMGDLQIVNNQIWIAGNWPLKIARYNADGKLISDWISDKFYNFYLMTWIIEHNRFLTVSFHQDEMFGSPERRRVSTLIDREENVLQTYFNRSKAGPMILTVGKDRPLQVAFRHPVIVPRILHAFDYNKEILYCLFNREYRVELKNLAGKTLMIVYRDHEDIKVNSKDKVGLIDLLATKMSPQVKAEVEEKLPDVFCAISGIVPLNNGYFALKRVTGAKSVELDIFDQEGRYIYLIAPSEEISDLESFHFFEDSAGQIVHFEDRDVYTKYRVTNLPEIY